MTTTQEPTPRIEAVKIDQLSIDPTLQPRVALDQSAVEDYAALYRDGGPESLPPLRAWIGDLEADDDAPTLWLTQGFTRLAAAKLAGMKELPVEIHTGDDRDMLIDALGGNKHGVRLSNADKRRAVDLYHDQIHKEEWESTREVARLIGCSHQLVATARKELTDNKQEKSKAHDASTPTTQPATSQTSNTTPPPTDGAPEPAPTDVETTAPLEAGESGEKGPAVAPVKDNNLLQRVTGLLWTEHRAGRKCQPMALLVARLRDDGYDVDMWRIILLTAQHKKTFLVDPSETPTIQLTTEAVKQLIDDDDAEKERQEKRGTALAKNKFIIDAVIEKVRRQQSISLDIALLLALECGFDCAYAPDDYDRADPGDVACAFREASVENACDCLSSASLWIWRDYPEAFGFTAEDRDALLKQADNRFGE